MAPPKGHPPYPGCETGGRPKQITDDAIDHYAEALMIWSKDPKNIFVEEFALDVMDRAPPALQRWAQMSNKFAEALEFAKHQQERKLKAGGLNRKYSDSFTKFLLINNHGVQKYADKTETTISGNPESPFTCIVNLTKELINEQTATAESQEPGRTGCY